MAGAGLDKNAVVEKGAQSANKMGLETITMKILVFLAPCSGITNTKATRHGTLQKGYFPFVMG